MNICISDFMKYRSLFLELVKKDIKLKYRNSVLGILWSMLNPMLMMIVLTLIFSALFKKDIPYFPVYVLIGRVIYQAFSESTNIAMDSIYANAQLIRKVYVPRYFFPLSKVCSSFITSIISFVPLCFVMIIIGLPFSWTNLLFFIPLIYLFIISAGISLLLSAVTVFFRDIKHFYSIVLLVVMYMTPIFYPASIIPEQYKTIIYLNPLYSIVEIFRAYVMYNTMPDFSLHFLSIIYMVVFASLGIWVFKKTQDKFIFHI